MDGVTAPAMSDGDASARQSATSRLDLAINALNQDRDGDVISAVKTTNGSLLLQCDSTGRNLLHWSILKGSDKLVENLLDALLQLQKDSGTSDWQSGAPGNDQGPLRSVLYAIDCCGETPLHLATRNSSAMKVYLMTKLDPWITMWTPQRTDSALQVAVEQLMSCPRASKTSEVLNAMLLGAIESKSEMGPTFVKQLLKRGAASDTWAPSGLSALMIAASMNMVDVMRLLIQNSGCPLVTVRAKAASGTATADGADVHLADGQRRTALMHAAMNEHVEAIALLLEFGAQVSQQDAAHKTALDYCKVGLPAHTLLASHFDRLKQQANQIADELLQEEEAAKKEPVAKQGQPSSKQNKKKKKKKCKASDEGKGSDLGPEGSAHQLDEDGTHSADAACLHAATSRSHETCVLNDCDSTHEGSCKQAATASSTPAVAVPVTQVHIANCALREEEPGEWQVVEKRAQRKRRAFEVGTPSEASECLAIACPAPRQAHLRTPSSQSNYSDFPGINMTVTVPPACEGASLHAHTDSTAGGAASGLCHMASGPMPRASSGADVDVDFLRLGSFDDMSSPHASEADSPHSTCTGHVKVRLSAIKAGSGKGAVQLAMSPKSTTSDQLLGAFLGLDDAPAHVAPGAAHDSEMQTTHVSACDACAQTDAAESPEVLALRQRVAQLERELEAAHRGAGEARLQHDLDLQDAVHESVRHFESLLPRACSTYAVHATWKELERHGLAPLYVAVQDGLVSPKLARDVVPFLVDVGARKKAGAPPAQAQTRPMAGFPAGPRAPRGPRRPVPKSPLGEVPKSPLSVCASACPARELNANAKPFAPPPCPTECINGCTESALPGAAASGGATVQGCACEPRPVMDDPFTLSERVASAVLDEGPNAVPCASRRFTSPDPWASQQHLATQQQRERGRLSPMHGTGMRPTWSASTTHSNQRWGACSPLGSTHASTLDVEEPWCDNGYGGGTVRVGVSGGAHVHLPDSLPGSTPDDNRTSLASTMAC